MSRWNDIIEQHRKRYGLSAWDTIPESTISEIASQCGSDELQDLERRLKQMIKEESDIPAWDGDSLDEIRKARQLFETILQIKADT